MWLAAEVFHKPLWWCLENIDSAEFTLWMAYYTNQQEAQKPSKPKQTPLQMQCMLRTAFGA